MQPFSDRLINSVRKKGSPCIVGLDPRIDLMPKFIQAGRGAMTRETASATITDFHELILDTVADLVPAIKPQLAFYEQYGLAGMEAFDKTVRAAQSRGLLVIADGKRNDIASTAEAYAAAFLGDHGFRADAMTVTPYLGRDSLEPFVAACAKHGKGLFVVLKTSNPGSRDFQDQRLETTGLPLYETIAAIINDLGHELVGREGYSSIGTVIGATFPEDAARLRRLMARAIILVPGYGAQGATAQSAAASFHADGLGAVVNSARGITYGFKDANISKATFVKTVRENTQRMIDDINSALKSAAISAPTPVR